jgi:hypothetical protein
MEPNSEASASKDGLDTPVTFGRTASFGWCKWAKICCLVTSMVSSLTLPDLNAMA